MNWKFSSGLQIVSSCRMAHLFHVSVSCKRVYVVEDWKNTRESKTKCIEIRLIQSFGSVSVHTISIQKSHKNNPEQMQLEKEPFHTQIKYLSEIKSREECVSSVNF